MKLRFLVLVLVLFSISACGKAPLMQPLVPPSPVPPLPLTPPQSMTFDQTATPKSGDQIALIKTNKGIIKINFFPQFASETVKNFTELTKKGFYNKLKFHRVIPDFMIQGGDPMGTGTGGETYKGPGTTLKAETVSELKHIRGAVSMARKGDDLNSATSQFFIVQNKGGVSSLDGQYTVFGQVFEGTEVVDAIASVERDPMDAPLKSVIMESVTLQIIP